jgi:hypothetical protein
MEWRVGGRLLPGPGERLVAGRAAVSLEMWALTRYNPAGWPPPGLLPNQQNKNSENGEKDLLTPSSFEG